MFDDDELPGEIPEDAPGYLVHLVPARSVDMLGYWCVVCMRYIPEDENGMLVHDKVPHPTLMTFDDDARPQ